MDGNIFNSRGVHVGMVVGSSIFDLRGQRLYDLKGTNVYKLSGELVGEIRQVSAIHSRKNTLKAKRNMKRGPRPKRSKGTWYVAFEPKEWLPGQRAFLRKTETFRNEQDAKAFAKAKLTDGSNINAGTLNPYQPKRTISSIQLHDWLDEPARRSITK